MNAKLTLLALLAALLVPATPSAASCLPTDVADCSIRAESGSTPGGCDDGIAYNGVSAWARVGDGNDQDARANTGCYGPVGDPGTGVRQREARHVEVRSAGTLTFVWVHWSVWEYEHTANGTKGEDCRVVVYAGSTAAPRHSSPCPLGLAPPRVEPVFPVALVLP